MVLEKIKKTLEKILLFHPYLGWITAKWDIKESNEVPTMGTDYKSLLVNKEFVDKLSLNEVGGVIIHEIVHCLFLHPTEVTRAEQKGKNPKLWNIATEIVTNAATLDIIKQSSMPFVLPGTPFSPLRNNYSQFEGKDLYFYDSCGHEESVEEIYKKLKEQNNIEFPNIHPLLFEDILKVKEKNSESSESVITATQTAIAVLSSLCKKIQGSAPLSFKRQLQKLTTAQIPWQRILHNFVSSSISAGMDDLSWNVPARRNPYKDVLLPGTVSENLSNIVVAVDTSGSISGKELEQFASEITSLARYTEEITVITCDARVHEKIKVTEANSFLKKIRFLGRGGTDFRPVFNEVKKALCLVFFTDGYGTYPQLRPPYPVLWVMTKNHSAPPFGKVVFML